MGVNGGQFLLICITVISLILAAVLTGAYTPTPVVQQAGTGDLLSDGQQNVTLNQQFGNHSGNATFGNGTGEDSGSSNGTLGNQPNGTVGGNTTGTSGSQTGGNGTSGNGTNGTSGTSDNGTSDGNTTGNKTGGDTSTNSSSDSGEGTGASSGSTQAETIGGGGIAPKPSTSIGGKIGELSTRVIFTVSARRPALWRTGAYANYTGMGWTRSPDTVVGPYPGKSNLETNGTTLRQTIKFATTASGIPGAWAPLRTNVSERVRIGSEGGLRLTRSVAANTTVTVVSELVQPPVSVVRKAGSDDPAHIQGKYTALPESVPKAVGEKTAAITANASTRYETVLAIQRYLEREKTYSLNISRPSENAAATFLFEMEKGYCQYFATTMVVMLRTQGIPARYVVGYSPGQAVGNNTFVVRGMNAHAWVEVYFPDVGWVRFDPTPAAPRLQSERQGLNGARSNGTNGTDTNQSTSAPYPGRNNATESNDGSQNQSNGGLAGDTTVKNDSTSQETQNRTDSDQQKREELNVTTLSAPIPGKTVVVQVTRNGTPVSGATVEFNNVSIGTTNESGEIRGQVPYTKHLRITVTAPADAEDDELANSLAMGSGVQSGAAMHPGTSQRFYALEAAPLVLRHGDGRSSVSLSELPSDNGTRTNTSYDLETVGNLTVQGDRIPGTVVTVTATIRGVPIRQANVTINGEFAGRTNDTGALTVRLPYAENVTINATRGAVSARTQVALADMQIAVNRPVIAGEKVLATVTIGNRSVSKARLTVGNRTIGRTNADGQLTLRVPYQSEVKITARRGGLSERVNLSIETNATLSVTGDPFPGSNISVTAQIEDVPVRRANITLDGRFVGRTNATGTGTVSLPYRENVTLSVTRGDVSATRRLTLASTLAIQLLSDAPLVPGEQRRISVVVDNRTISGMAIDVGNQTVGQTNADGQLTFTVPYRSAIKVTAHRGGLSDRVHLDIHGNLSLDVEGWDLPFATQTVRVTLDGTPVKNATVTFGGEVVGTTDETGVLTARLPLANSLMIRAQRGTLTATRSLSGLLIPVVGIVGLLTLVGGAIVTRRRSDSIRRSGGDLLSRCWAAVVVGIPALLDRAVGVLEMVYRNVRETVYLTRQGFIGVRRLFARIQRLPRIAVVRFRYVFQRLSTRARRLFRWVRALDLATLLHVLQGRLFGRSAEMSGSTSRESTAQSGTDTAVGATSEEPADRSFDIEEAWAWLVGRVSVSRRSHRTPEYLASEAIAQGYDQDAVETLLAAYRDAIYGDRTLSDTQVQRARSAFQQLKTAETSTARETTARAGASGIDDSSVNLGREE